MKTDAELIAEFIERNGVTALPAPPRRFNRNASSKRWPNNSTGATFARRIEQCSI
jgi:hypothetical protein